MKISPFNNRYIGLIIVGSVIIAFSFFTLFQIFSFSNDIKAIKLREQKTKTLLKMNRAFNAFNDVFRELAAGKEDFENLAPSAVMNMKDAINELTRYRTSKREIQETKPCVDKLLLLENKLNALYSSGLSIGSDEMQNEFKALFPVLESIGNHFFKLSQYSHYNLETYLTTKEKKAAASLLLAVVVSIIAFIVALFPSHLIDKQLKIAINDVTDAGRLALANNFTSTIDLDSHSVNYLGELPHTMSQLIRNNSSLINRMSKITHDVKKLTEKLSGSFSEQTHNYMEHSSAITEITSTIEELSSSANRVADNTKNVLKISEETLKISEEGQTLADNTLRGMEKIRNDSLESTNKISELGKKSQKIGEVLIIINEIAKQTKFLSLNAAIEAAKAGEYGKGFEVVSTEIRDLAENVVKSTGRIKNIIEDIHDSVTSSIMANELGTKQVELGLNSTKQNKEALVEIVAMAQKTNNSTKQIGIATQQQRVANEQVLVGMKEIAEANQIFDKKIKEATSFVSDLSKAARELDNFIAKYKI
ncbi:MAG: methyl-accepting chemotaxis protein [bacterium]